MIGNFSGSNPGTLEAFLAAMDGMDESRGVVNRILVSLGFPPLSPPEIRRLFIGATNMPDTVDKALLRPGRLSRKIHVDYFDHHGKIQTYQGYLGKVTHNVSDEELERLVRNHQPATGAEVQAVVNEAVLATFRHGDGDGLVTYDGLAEQLRIEKVGEPGEAFEIPENRWWVAVHEAGHAVMAHHKQRHLADIWFSSIVSHGTSGGLVARAPHTDDWLRKQSDLEEEIMIALSSRVAEELFFEQPSNGQGGDGRKATQLAADMVSYGHHAGQVGSWFDEKSDSGIAMAEEILTTTLEATREFLEARQDQVEAVAAILLHDLTVDGQVIHEMLDEMEAA
jgi:ATP-dependent Zn protease